MLKDRISYCIYNANFQKDIIPCIEKCLADCHYEIGRNKAAGLSLEDIFEITENIATICEIRGFKLEDLFMQLWWSENTMLNKLGSFLIQRIYHCPTYENIKSILKISERIENVEMANYFSYNIAQIINKNLTFWKHLIIELFLVENIWINFAAANTLLLLAQRYANLTIPIIQIITRIKLPMDIKTLQRLETVFENLSFHLNITVHQLKTKYLLIY